MYIRISADRFDWRQSRRQLAEPIGFVEETPQDRGKLAGIRALIPLVMTMTGMLLAGASATSAIRFTVGTISAGTADAG